MASEILMSIGSTTNSMLNGPNSRSATFIRASTKRQSRRFTFENPQWDENKDGKVERTDIVVPLDAEIGLMGQTSFEDVETIVAARFDVTESLANGTHGHPHDGSHALAAAFQLRRQSQ